MKKFFTNIKTKPESSIVISPHAGYIYSGRTAAAAISSLKPADVFIMLGPNHTGIGLGFSIMGSGSWKTPLGDAEIDQNLADALKKKCAFLEEDEGAHANEHSIEVQMPFLQYRFGKIRFVPVCINQEISCQEFAKKCIKLGEAIADLSGNSRISVVASSDFSHYVPLDAAEKQDGMAIKEIKKLDVSGFFKTIEENNVSVCGFGPIAAAMAAAKKLGLKAEVISSSSSGDETGDFSSVVAYYAISFK